MPLCKTAQRDCTSGMCWKEALLAASCILGQTFSVSKKHPVHSGHRRSLLVCLSCVSSRRQSHFACKCRWAQEPGRSACTLGSNHRAGVLPGCSRHTINRFKAVEGALLCACCSCGECCLVRYVKSICYVRWLGHTFRTPNGRLPKKLLFGRDKGTHTSGRPRLSYNDVASSD